MASVTCGLTAEDRDQLRNPTVVSSTGLLALPQTGDAHWQSIPMSVYNKFGSLWSTTTQYVYILNRHVPRIALLRKSFTSWEISLWHKIMMWNYVKIGYSFSSTCTVTGGVTQESVFGPVLFIFVKKKCSEWRKHCALAVVRPSQNFLPCRRPLPGGVGRTKFNQLETVTTFTYKPSSVRINARNFELSW